MESKGGGTRFESKSSLDQAVYWKKDCSKCNTLDDTLLDIQLVAT